MIIVKNIVIGSALSNLELNRPLICYDNVFKRGTITTDSEDADENGFARNAVDGFTYDFWKPLTLPAYIQVDLEEAEAVNYSAISIHSEELTYKFQYWDGSSWVDLHSEVEATRNTKLITFETQYSNSFRFVVTDSSDTDLPIRVGAILLGQYVRIPKLFYRGHQPSVLNRKVEIVRNETELGLVSGIYTTKKGTGTEVQINNISPQWVRENLNIINVDLQEQPFVFSWRPFSEPDDAVYAWLINEITATNNGRANLMDIKFSYNCNVGDNV